MDYLKILITGGSGFIGSNFIRFFLKKHASTKIVNLDKLTYAGRQENLLDVEKDSRYKFIQGDICDPAVVEKAMAGCDAVVHFAAESHVDRSISDSGAFIQTNVFGTFVVLEAARKAGVKKFVQISTDEVYGQILEGKFSESSPLLPRNPYSASKCAADRLAYSFFATYHLPVVITRSSNNYGPFQFPEKVIPLFATNLLRGKKVPLYGEGKQIRDWLHVDDNAEAIDVVLHQGKNGEVYNIGGGNEVANIDLTRLILSHFKKGNESIERVADRLGHDFRYALDTRKIERELGWKPRIEFKKGLAQTLDWYHDNEWWWKPLVKG